MEASALATINYLGWGPSDTALICLNPQFVAGKMMIVRALKLGMRFLAVEPAAHPLKQLDQKWLSIISVTAMVPLQLETILIEEGVVNFKKKCPFLRCILLGGSAISTALFSQIQSLEIPIWHTYGMTETCSHIALKRLNGPNPDDDFKILPGNTISVDERGCLVIEGDVCYQNRVVTNDLVELTSEKSFIWKGRYDRVVNSGGMKIHLDSLEEELQLILASTNWQGEFFLFGGPHPKFGEQLCMAFTSDLDEQTTQSIFDKSFRNLKSIHRPGKILRLEKFEYTGSGKIDRLKMISTLLSSNQ